MNIAALELVCRDLDGQRRFYRELLGLPLLETSEAGFTVQIGSTRLRFQQGDSAAGVYHFAFNIPDNQLAAARDWLSARTLLLKKGEQDEFEGSPDWNARMLYFGDADGNILECVARQRLKNASAAPFGPASLLNISEIGYPVADVPRTCRRLKRELGLTPFGKPSNTFAPLGDDHGLIIVVPLGRSWFPTNEVASALPLKITLSGVHPKLLEEDAQPYVISGPLSSR